MTRANSSVTLNGRYETASVLDAMGDKEGFNAASLRLKQRQQTLLDFTNSTGRTNRNEKPTRVTGFTNNLK